MDKHNGNSGPGEDGCSYSALAVIVMGDMGLRMARSDLSPGKP